jgi:hypothetical protein
MDCCCVLPKTLEPAARLPIAMAAPAITWRRVGVLIGVKRFFLSLIVPSRVPAFRNLLGLVVVATSA